MSEVILKRFYRFLVESIPGCVVKYGNVARDNETVESRRNGDHFVSASLGTDSLLFYPTLSNTVLQNAGFTAEEIRLYRNDPMSIPRERVSTTLTHARAEFISNYVEQNNYYRMLNGLPDYDSMEEIWFDDLTIYDEYNLEPCPVHEIPHRYLKAMEDRGMLEELKQYHPDAKYLEYLGNRRIDIISARRADNFEMLYFPNITDSYSFYRSFLNLYDECRQYFLTVVYNQFFSTKYDQYDGYIGFMIMVLTINRMIVSNFKAFIERDFYDEFSTQIFLGAYGVPYSTRFTLSQMKLLAKNLNILLRMKGTDLALLDVIALLGYQDFTLSKYYLVRQHMLDGDGNPIFQYKTDEETGEKVLDPDSMYSYHFSRVPVTDENVQEALRDVTNRMSYLSVTSMDKYWIEDESVRNKIRETRFNYIETKYMDMTIVYRMHAILFETVYLTRAILDKHQETKKITVSLAKISPLEIPIFDVMVFLISIVCKFYHVEPTLMNTPSKVLHIAGFNYNADIEAIREDIMKHPDIYNQEILKYINEVVFTKPTDINNFYVQIKNLNVALIRLINTATTLESYRAYRKLYDTLLYIEYNNEIYRLPNGDIPEKFTEYLEFANPQLYLQYESLETDDDISNCIGYVTARLMNIFTSAKYLNYIQVMDTSLLEALTKLISYFKSLTVDMRGVNIILLFDDRVLNTAHLYHKITMEGGDLDISEWAMNSAFWEYVKRMSAELDFGSLLASTDDLARAMADYYNRQNIYTSEELQSLLEDIHMTDEPITSFELMTKSEVYLPAILTKVLMEDNYRMLAALTDIESVTIKERMSELQESGSIVQKLYTGLETLILHILTYKKEKLSISDLYRMMQKIPRILKFYIKDSLVEGVLYGSLQDRSYVDLEQDMVESLMKKEYSKFAEEFTIYTAEIMLGMGMSQREFTSAFLKEISFLTSTVSVNESVKTNDSYIRMIWEE